MPNGTFKVELHWYVCGLGLTGTREVYISDLYIEQYSKAGKDECRFTAEVLNSGEVAFCIEHPEYGDIVIDILPDVEESDLAPIIEQLCVAYKSPIGA